MPSNSKLFVKPFIGGLNTETSSVEDAILNTADELNCTILPEGIRGRRLGFNIERDGKWIESNPSTSYSGYVWKNVNKTGQDILVQQVGTTLYFFDNIKPFTGSEENLLGTCSLILYTRNMTNGELGSLNYAIGDGLLYVVNDNIKPVRIKAATNKDGTYKFIPEEFTLYIRDLDGVEDGLRVDEMPSGETSDNEPYKGLSNEHFYNLLNQGWNDDDLVQFVKDKNKWPSNNLQWFVGKDDSGNYNTEKLLQQYFGNTPAPKGHFIIDYFNEDRSNVSGIFGLSPHTAAYSYSRYWVEDRAIEAYSVKSFFLDVNTPGTTDAAKQYFNTPTIEGEVLKSIVLNFAQIERKSAKKSHDGMWSGKVKFTVYGGNTVKKFDNSDGRLTWEEYVLSLYSKVSGQKWLLTDYEEIYQETIVSYGASSKDPWVIRLQIPNDKYFKYYRVFVEFDEGTNTASDYKHPIAVKCRANFYTAGQDDSIFADSYKADTITDITYMPGRLFYLCNDTVLFSQVIKNNGSGFENCHQEADPTSEEISDIVPTDGGYVKFNNIGVGRALESFNRGVLVFGENIVYGLISPMEKAFSASDYDILELSRAGIIGDRSVVSTDNMVYYWSPLGIFRIGINPNTGSSIVAECITHTTIQEFYDRIPNASKETCRGCFDYVNNRIYWYYSETDGEKPTPHKLNKCLVLDLTNGSFMPFKLEGDAFVTDAFNSKVAYEISPTMYLRAGGDRVVANGEYVVADEEDTDFKRWTAIQHTVCKDDGSFSFGDYNSREFKDFDTTSYDSYMVSRPIMFEGYSRLGNPVNGTFDDKQVPILQTLFKRTEQNVLKSVAKEANKISTYNLKEYVQYASSWPEYTDAKPGTLKHFMFAQTAVMNTGLFQDAEVKVDLSSFVGESFSCAVKIVTDTDKIFILKRDYNNFNKLSDTFVFDGDGEEYKVFNISVEVVNESATYTGKKIGIAGTLRLIRTNAGEDTFTGFETKVLKGSVKLNKQAMSFEYKGSTRIEPSFITSGKFAFSSDEEWTSKAIEAYADNMNFFYAPGSHQPLNYGVDFKDGDDAESFPQSITNGVDLRKTLNFTVTRTPGIINYEVGVAVPVFKKEEGLFTTTTDYIGASGANIRMRWGWSLNDRSNRWDMVQNGYRPQKDFLHDEYVESRLHVRGRGKAFQIEIRNDDNKDFRLAGMNLLVRSR